MPCVGCIGFIVHVCNDKRRAVQVDQLNRLSGIDGVVLLNGGGGGFEFLFGSLRFKWCSEGDVVLRAVGLMAVFGVAFWATDSGCQFDKSGAIASLALHVILEVLSVVVSTDARVLNGVGFDGFLGLLITEKCRCVRLALGKRVLAKPDGLFRRSIFFVFDPPLLCLNFLS